jgi:1-acyl-sn-glycerol-3-phosphate acyltransferase
MFNQLQSGSATGSPMGARLAGSRLLYYTLYPVAWVLVHLFCRYRVSGREHIPRNGQLLIVANHLSWFDPILFCVVFPRRLWFFAKIEAFDWFVVGWICRVTEQIPVHRGEGDRAALEKALAYLHEGRALVIFPEGTVERQEQMIPAYTGAAMLALRSGATILPLAHTGTRRVFRLRGGLLPRVNIRIGEPYVPALPEGSTRKAGLQAITQDVMSRIAQMLPPEQRGVYK